MNVRDLTREQLTELKQNYLTTLADSGQFAEIMGVDYDEPSMGDLANADEIVPDDVIFENYDGVDFVEDDFCSDSDDYADEYERGSVAWELARDEYVGSPEEEIPEHLRW